MSKALILLTFFLNLMAAAQRDVPDNGPLYLQDEVARVDILIPFDTLTLMYEDISYASTHEFRADFVYTAGGLSDTVYDIGFRLRGHTSLFSAKKSFKVSFNTFNSGGSYHGVEKMNLNGEHNDPSIMRAKLAWDMLAELGLPSCRTSHVELYLDGIYAGLYLNVEHIDEEYVKKRFGPSEGNLYKCLWGANLTWQGSQESTYQNMGGDFPTYDLKTNLQRDDYSRFVHFVDVLNNWSTDAFACEIHRIFNVDDYLKIAAFEILIGHWDGYIVNNNNYYLYENPRSGRFEYLVYDPDNTMGIDWFGINWTQRNIYNWQMDQRPLYTRLMNIPEYRQQFSAYVQQISEDYFNEEGIIAHAQEVMTLITPFALADEIRTYDYGFTEDDFLNSIDEAWGNHVDFGIAEYVTSRRNSALAQLEAFTFPQVIKETRDSLTADGSHILDAWVEGAIDQMKVRVFENGTVLYETILSDLGGGHYQHEHSSTASYSEYQFISSRDGEELETPCEPKRLWNDVANGPIIINELMASNSSVIADGTGAYEDWFELYNAGIFAIYLGDKYITDDILMRDKWQLPEMMLGPGQFLLVWADDDPSQGPLHTDFKLSASGEELAIYAPENGALRRWDEVVFPALATDVSWGRLTDAGEPWVLFTQSTPEASNGTGTVGLEDQEGIEQIGFYPNPAVDLIRFSEPLSGLLRLWDIRGALVLERTLNQQQDLDLSQLGNGLFMMEVQREGAQALNARLLIQH